MSNYLNIRDRSGCLETIRNSSEIVEKVDYTENLYQWNVSKSEFQIVDDCLAQVDTLLDNTLTYYGNGREGG